MRIEDVTLWHVSVPLPAPFYPSWIPGLPQTENRFTLVRVGLACGTAGWSAGPAMAKERQGMGSLLGPYLLGERADDLASIRQRLREMSYLGWHLGWLEAACWDAVGRARGVPVWQLLGGKPGRVQLYASTGDVKDGKARVAELEKRRAEGFTSAKLRVHKSTLAEDLEQIEVCAQAMGGDFKMGIDANQGWRVAVVADAPTWDVPRALAFARRAGELGYKWLEEPLANDDYEAMAALRRQVEIPIAGAELNHHGLPEIEVMLQKRCLDVYQPDAVFAGGISETWRIVQAVARHGARYTPHTWTNGIGFAINLALFAASPWRDDTVLEYPLSEPGWIPEFRDGLLQKPWHHDKGWLDLPTTPGLGFEIDGGQLWRHGSQFYRGTKLRVSLAAVLDKGIATAKEIGKVRDERLAARRVELEKRTAAGEDLLRAFAQPATATNTGWKLQP